MAKKGTGAASSDISPGGSTTKRPRRTATSNAVGTPTPRSGGSRRSARSAAGRSAAGRSAPRAPENPFRALLGVVQRDVDERLLALLDGRVDVAERHGSEVGEMIATLRDLCQRGGKRLRPALVMVGARAVRAEPPRDLVLQAGVALELLQAYFLIHDDWMDQDLERRGGPTVHAHLGRRFRSSLKGASAAILTGDYAVALATRVLATLDVPGRRLPGVLTCFADMQLDAVAGQGLDVIGRSRDAELTYRLKTASYTVRGPLVMGALLAGGSPALQRTLEQFALPAGVAFQLRDDLIGVFGDPARTGKPRGGDLKAGKRTLLVELALKRCRGQDRRTLQTVLGSPRATERQVERAIGVLEESGAREAVEERISSLGAEARQLLERGRLTVEGRELLLGAVDALTSRES